MHLTCQRSKCVPRFLLHLKFRVRAGVLLIATTDFYGSRFTASCFLNYTREVSFLKELLTSPCNVLVQQFIQSPGLSMAHLHSLFTPAPWIIAKLKVLFTAPEEYIYPCHDPIQAPFQNGTAYPTDPLYNLLTLHLILELSASEWLEPHQREQVTH